MKISDYNITDNGTITLIKVLKTISDTLRHVTFDFSWEYVGCQRDFLNASAILYSGSTRVDCVDFKKRMFCSGGYGFEAAVSHSGHGFKNNRYGKRGNHIIEVNFPLLNTSSVDKVFFTLSSLNAESIEDFRHLTLDFHDSRNPSEQLDEISRAVQNHKAIVFCCLCRIDGSWQVFGLQEPSSGNVRYYYPLFYTIENLIRQGFS
jgi:stress response protein SCP2